MVSVKEGSMKKAASIIEKPGGATTKLMVMTKQILTPEEMKKDWERLTSIRVVGGGLIHQTIITISETELGTQG